MSLKIAHFVNDSDNHKKNAIKRMVEHHGYQYFDYPFFNAGPTQLTQGQFDAIIIEGSRFGLIDFLTILKGLRLEEEFVTPFIVVSEQTDFELQALFFDLGAMGFMSYEAFDPVRLMTYLYAIKRDRETLKTLQSYRIAVIDDSRLSLAVLRDYFKRLELDQVDYYQSSADFMASKTPYQLVILDLVMPEYSGEDLIYHIRRQHQNTIILLMSAYSDSPVITHCLKIGADDFIIKPLEYRLFTLRLLNAISSFILTKENMAMNQRLYEMATRDSLTGAFNRSYFIEYLDHRLAELARKPEDFTALLIDIDHFKMINDDYGHLKGDEVLNGISKALNMTIRESDVLCRWGGEEFVVLLPNTAIAHGGLVAEKLRAMIEGMDFGLGKKITVSIGVSDYQSGDLRDTLFKRLDNSLYLAKLTGRNKVVVDEELQILRSGLPVSIEWGPFFRSGHPQVDHEHEQLISLSNQIIVDCFRENNNDRIISLFSHLLEETQRHFTNEERILEHFEYNKLVEHQRIHNDLLMRTKSLFDGLVAGRVTAVNLAKYLIQDVVVGHIIKSDFEFYDVIRTSAS